MTITKSLHEELAEIFAALQIHSLTTFSFRDGVPIQASGHAHGLAQPNNHYAPLLNGICNVLYGSCYVRNCAPGDASAQQNMIPLLMQANQTRDRWDPGWSIYQMSWDGRVSVQKGERSRTAVVGEYATNKAPGMPPQAGDQVNLRVHPGFGDMQQGFYFAFGNTLADQYDDYTLLRFYFNVKAEGAVTLLHAVSSRFNYYSIPYRYKTLANSAAYTRADAAVLYVAKRYYHVAVALVTALAGTLEGCLRAETPMFSKTLTSGVGLAEDPGTGESFGLHRCRLVAEGIIDAWTAGSQSIDKRMEAVQKRFSACGITLEQPYLNARSVDLFANTIFTGGIDL